MKTVTERPSTWHVIVTCIAMLYLNNFIGDVATPLLFPGSSWRRWIFDLAMLAVWFFLFRDLIRQVSRFFRKKSS